jgi:hypothetical protein
LGERISVAHPAGMEPPFSKLSVRRVVCPDTGTCRKRIISKVRMTNNDPLYWGFMGKMVIQSEYTNYIYPFRIIG